MITPEAARILIAQSIELWDDEPTSLQILKTLDNIVFAGAASEFVVNALDIAMRQAMDREGSTYEQIISQAEWRHSYQGGSEYYNQ